MTKLLRMVTLGLAFAVLGGGVAMATPIGVFSGDMRSWFLNFDPFSGNALMSFTGVTVQLDADSNIPGFETYQARIETLEIDLTVPPIPLPPTGFDYQIVSSYIVAGMIIEDGMGGEAEFDLRLNWLSVFDATTGYLDARVEFDDVTLRGNTSNIFDFSLYVMGGDFVASLQTTGPVSLLYALQNRVNITDGNRTSGSFTVSPTIPEPGTWLLIGAGLSAMVWRRRNRAR